MQITTWLTHPDVPAWTLSPAQAAQLQAAFPQATIVRTLDAQAFREALPTTDVALIWTFHQEWFAVAPRLSKIVTPAAGKDYFQLAPPPRVTLHYGSFHGELIGETVAAWILGECRGVPATLRLQNQAPWPRRELSATLRPLRGAQVTILGFGHIGRWIARLLAPFGPRLTGVRRTASTPNENDVNAAIIPLDNLDEILPATDHLVLSLPGGEASRHLLDARRLERLPAHAVVYNVGRGNAIDENALAARLREGRLAGAYLDVYETEPLPPDSPLRGCPNTLLMPHASAISPNYLDLFIRDFIRDFREAIP